MAITAFQPYSPPQAGAVSVANHAPGFTPRVYFGGQNGSIKVMSYNCQRFYLYNSGRMAKPGHKIADLGKIIRQEDPDILCLQEVGGEKQLEGFNRQYLNGVYQTIIAGQSSNSHEPYGPHVAILAKKGFTVKNVNKLNRYVFIHDRGYELPNGHRYMYPYHEYVSPSHPILEVTLEDPNGHEVTVINAHFKATTTRKRNDYTPPNPSAQRLQEARIVADLIRKKKEENPDAEIILAGDLNTDADRPESIPIIRALSGVAGKDDQPVSAATMAQAPLMREPFLAHVPDEDEQVAEGAQDTHRLNSHRGKLDYLWASPALFQRITSYKVVGSLKSRFYRKVSDHLPVTMEYMPKPAAAAHAVSFGQQLDRIA